MKKLIGLLALIALVSGCGPVCAQGIIAPGHVMGNGTASVRTATDTPLSSILDQNFSGIGLMSRTGTGAYSILSGATAGRLLVDQGSGSLPAFVVLSGDGTLAANGTFNLGASGVTAGTYGDATHVAQVTIDAKGRATSASSVTITHASGDLAASNNLSDVASASASRTNLGLGDLATQNAGTGLGNSGSSLNLQPGTASTIGGVEAVAAVPHEFMTSIASGVPILLQPQFSDIAGSATLSQLPIIGNNTILGNVSGAANVPAALTQAQVTALINPFTSLLSGAVPASAGGTSNFLRADGIWATPAGAGNVIGTGPSVVGDLPSFNNTGATGIGDSGIQALSLLKTIPAKCDGTTIDTTVINNELANIASTGGGTGVLPAGTCVFGVADTLELPSYTNLIGQGSATFVPGSASALHKGTTLLWKGGITAVAAVDVGAGADARSSGLQDLTIDGDLTPTTSTFKTGVSLHGSIYGTFRDVTVQNIGTAWNLNASGTSAQDNNTWNSFYNIKANNVNFGIVLSGNGDTSSTSQSTDNFFYNPQIFAPRSVGILFEQYCDSNTFIGGFGSFGHDNAGTLLSGVIGIELNNQSPATQLDVYGENFFGFVMDVYSTTSNVNNSIVVNDTGQNPGDGTNNIFIGEIGQASTGPVVPIVQNGGSMLFQLTLGTGPAGYTGTNATGTPTASHKTIMGVEVVH